jgi:signal transduction histidine kinase
VLSAFNVLLAGVATLLATKELRRREALVEERTAELEMFAGRVAHDVMSPLASVSLALELARERSGNDQVARFAGRALQSMNRLSETVRALFDFASAGGHGPAGRAGAPEAVTAILDELRPVADEAHVALSGDPVPACDVACPPGIVGVVLNNLVRNAIKHMGESTRREVRIAVVPQPARVRFEVHDTGPGLAPEVAERVFEPFVRAASSAVPGIGLGLATVKRLVEAHGGRVGVHVGREGGSIFWFDLPRLPAEPAQSPLFPGEEHPPMH